MYFLSLYCEYILFCITSENIFQFENLTLRNSFKFLMEETWNISEMVFTYRGLCVGLALEQISNIHATSTV